MIERSTRAALAAAAMALAGCASLPPPDRPATAAAPAGPDRWQASLPPTAPPATGPAAAVATPADATVPAWWAGFGDPLLPDLLRDAQSASPSLAAAAARIEQARAAWIAAGAARQPRLDAAAGIGRARSDLFTAPATVGSVGLQASWELDLFGANAAGRAAAQARLAGSEAARDAARVAVAAETATLYVALRACEAQLRQAEADARSREATARVTEAGERGGLIAPATAALARASAAQSRAQVASLAAQCGSLVKGLVALTAQDEPALRTRLAGAPGTVPQAPALTLPAVPAALLTRRADLQEAARAVEAAAADERAAQARRLPRVAVTGSLTALAVQGAVGTVDGTTWSLGPLQVTFPLFDGGALAAQADAARAAYDASVTAYRAAFRVAVREVEDALLQLQSAAAREADTRLAVEGFEASFRATEARFRGGLASAFELEDARRSQLAAQSARIDLQRERATAWISLYRALGGVPVAP